MDNAADHVNTTDDNDGDDDDERSLYILITYFVSSTVLSAFKIFFCFYSSQQLSESDNITLPFFTNKEIEAQGS